MKIQPNNPVPVTPKTNQKSVEKKDVPEERRIEMGVREESRLRDIFGNRFFGSEEYRIFLNTTL
ncbi:MAG: hypothetical protein HZA36_02940 [Parcubacteria group bacterium]|nr:hypothetical protein [Parcubacteria group bacterium]